MSDASGGFSWSALSAIVASAVALITAFGFGMKNARDKGSLEQKVKNMEDRVKGFDVQLADIKSCSEDAMSVSKVLATNIAWIKETLQDIKVSIKEIKSP